VTEIESLIKQLCRLCVTTRMHGTSGLSKPATAEEDTPPEPGMINVNERV
jgi:hypothetical protein